jgi:hypothetical protein
VNYANKLLQNTDGKLNSAMNYGLKFSIYDVVKEASLYILNVLS